MKKASLFFLLITVLGVSCKKDPPATDDPSPHILSNDVTALINGIGWESFAPIGQQEIQAQHYAGNYFDIEARKYVSQGISHIYMKVYGLNDTGTYILNDSNFAHYYDASQNLYYQTDLVYTGALRVSDFNYEDARISGEFEFIGKDAISGDTVSISEGTIYNVSFYKY